MPSPPTGSPTSSPASSPTSSPTLSGDPHLVGFEGQKFANREEIGNLFSREPGLPRCAYHVRHSEPFNTKGRVPRHHPKPILRRVQAPV